MDGMTINHIVSIDHGLKLTGMTNTQKSIQGLTIIADDPHHDRNHGLKPSFACVTWSRIWDPNALGKSPYVCTFEVISMTTNIDIQIWLVVWNMTLFFHIIGNTSSQLTFIFFRGVQTTNQLCYSNNFKYGLLENPPFRFMISLAQLPPFCSGISQLATSSISKGIPYSFPMNSNL